VDRIRREEGQDAQGQAAQGGDKPRVNIIGPSYGMFNMPSDLAEIRRLVEGIGAEVNLVFPLGSIWPMFRAGDADVNICMYREFGRAALRGAGQALSAGADRPAFDDQIPAHAGRACWARSRAVHRARKAHHHQAAVGLWRSVTQDFFGTASFGIVANETYARGVRNFLETRWACPARLPSRAGPARSPTTRRCATQSHKDAAAGHVRLLQRAHVHGRSRRRRGAVYVPASFPGAVIRRHTGTPFMGYSGATYLVQEVCNGLFDALFNILPLAKDLDQVDACRRAGVRTSILQALNARSLAKHALQQANHCHSPSCRRCAVTGFGDQRVAEDVVNPVSAG
jgi:chlorophyllide a reductase subunit Z